MGALQKTASLSTIARNLAWFLVNWKTIVSSLPGSVVAAMAYVGGQPAWKVIAVGLFVATCCLWLIIGIRAAVWGERPSIFSAKLFEVERVTPSAISDVLELTAVLNFLRRLRPATLTVRIGGEFTERSFVLFRSHEFVAGEQLSLVLAKIPNQHGDVAEWLPGRTEKQFGIVEGGRYIVSIDVQGRWFWQKQTYRIYFETLQPTRGTCGRFFYVEEARDLFEPLRIPRTGYG